MSSQYAKLTNSATNSCRQISLSSHQICNNLTPDPNLFIIITHLHFVVFTSNITYTFVISNYKVAMILPCFSFFIRLKFHEATIRIDYLHSKSTLKQQKFVEVLVLHTLYSTMCARLKGIITSATSRLICCDSKII